MATIDDPTGGVGDPEAVGAEPKPVDTEAAAPLTWVEGRLMPPKARWIRCLGWVAVNHLIASVWGHQAISQARVIRMQSH